MNGLTDTLIYVIRKVHTMNDANAKALMNLALQETRELRHDDALEVRAKAEGMLYANLVLQCELEKEGLADILKGK